MDGAKAAPGGQSFFSTELRLFGGLALAWLLGFGLFWFDRHQAAAFLPPGVLTTLLDCLLEASIIASLCLAAKRSGADRCFLWFFCLLLPADLCYLLLHYVLRRAGEDWLTFLLTTLPYSLAYVLGAIGLVRHIRPRLAGARWPSFGWLPILLLIPAIFGVLLPLLYAHQRAGGWSFELTEIAFNSVFAVIFFFWSAVTLLMSLDRVFPFVGLAGIVTQLGNWEGNSIYLRQPQAFGFGEYEFLWLCGIIAFWYAFVVVARVPEAAAAAPEGGRRRSLVVQQRMTIIGLISVSLILAAALPGRDAWSYRIVFFGIAIGAYISLIVGELLARQIVHYATLFGKVVDLTGREEPSPASGQEIPVELWKVYQMAFHEEMMEQRTKAAVRRNLAELAAQVAHDIRSPLAALDSVAKDLPGLPEEKRVILRGAAGRIHDIANDLLEKNRGSRAAAPGAGAAEPLTKELLSSAIAPLISEKRLQYRCRPGVAIESRLDAASSGIFARIQPAEFKRVLSNLINNAVEALGETGEVSVRLSCEGEQVLLKVCDNGKGIPPEVLARLGGRGETYGKAEGSGLGLYHAKASVAAWGGSLELSSEAGQGTTAAIRLPRARPPGPDAVLLDDDPLVRLNWKAAARAQGLELEVFARPAEFLAAVEGLPRATAIYLDSKLADGVRGEDIARDLHAKGFTELYLATGYDAGSVPASLWIKEVVGKAPPWG